MSEVNLMIWALHCDLSTTLWSEYNPSNRKVLWHFKNQHLAPLEKWKKSIPSRKHIFPENSGCQENIGNQISIMPSSIWHRALSRIRTDWPIPGPWLPWRDRAWPMPPLAAWQAVWRASPHPLGMAWKPPCALAECWRQAWLWPAWSPGSSASYACISG